MTDGDNGWQLFASTGKVSDYLKYRSKAFPETEDKTQENRQYERDLYGDGHGFVGNAHG